ncbi:hypothetical protein D1007_62252 [Hordeum vulgare]|nr:hypothetical protein D1007_62252 [Hordeum vulgare]
MDDDIDATTGLASFASSNITPPPPTKARTTFTTPKKKKELMPEERAWESAKRKGQRHAEDARDKAVVVAAIAVLVQRADTAARVATTSTEYLLYLGLNPGYHGLFNATVAGTNTSSSTFA